MKQKIRRLGLLVLMLAVFLFGGCREKLGEERYFAYRQQPFLAEINGNLSGVSFVATLEGKFDKKEGPRYCLTYSSPPALNGLCIELDKAQTQVRLGETVLVDDTEQFTGWARPINALMGTPQNDFAPSLPIVSVQREGKNWELKLEGGKVLTLSNLFLPLAYQDEQTELRIIWWEQNCSQNSP